MRIGQPRVEREQRHLDRKGDGKGEEEPVLRVERDVERVEPEQVEAVFTRGRVVHPREADDGHQHQHAAGHRVEDELDRGVDALVVAPDPDEEVHRDEQDVPEDVEEEEVERTEDADHGGLEDQHEDGELLHAALDALPGRQERNRRQEARQHDEHQAEAVDAQVVLDAEGRNPGVALDELERLGGRRGVEPGPEARVTAKVTSDTPKVMVRMRPSFEPSRLLTKSSTMAPSTGRRMASESIGRPVTARYLQR
ncbi:MAG: hypothetical protein R2712_05840 [Vicinamibacterales bacterium]